MTIKYQSWLDDYKELSTETGTQVRLDASNGTANKAKVQKGQLTALDVAKQNHEQGLHYEFCAFTDDDDIPYCYVTVVPRNKHIGVNFLDGAGRNYLSYLFNEVKDNGTLFIKEIWYYNFTGETNENEDYRIHFLFDEEGNISYRKYDEVNQKAEDYESNRRFDVSGLYEPYPVFGVYDSLVRLERDLPIDVIPPPSNPDNGGSKDDPNNKWLPPDWSKN